jgi:uncharacterized protein YjgD (DUF1641 family)
MSETDPVLQAIHRIADRLDALEAKVDAMAGSQAMLQRLALTVPVLADGAGAMAQQFIEQAEGQGVDVYDSAELGVSLAVKAADPRTLQALDDLMGKLELVQFAANAGEQLKGKLDEATDVDALVTTGIDVAVKLAKVAQTPEFQSVLNSGVLEAKGLAVVSSASSALVDTSASSVSPVGLFGALKMMGDPDVQKAVGFALAVAKQFGQRL